MSKYAMEECNRKILVDIQTDFCTNEKGHDGKCVASENLIANLSDELLNHISVMSDHFESFVKDENNLKSQSQKTRGKITILQSKINATAEQIKNLK